MKTPVIQAICRALIASLALCFVTYQLVAQTVPSDGVTERVGKQRGLELQLLVRNRAPLKQLHRHDFSYADVRGLTLLRPNLAERLAGLSFNEAYTNADYQSAKNLFTANLGKVRLKGARLDRVDLHGAYLAKANLSAASLHGTNLSKSILNEVNLAGADLSHANLRGAKLYRADLRNANLFGADLTGANLRGADLRGAELSGAKLAGTILTGEQIDAGGQKLLETE